jgi:NADH-quinone oxidoreductase subunit N
MLTGNLLAMQQNNLKRLMAYSSISHFGYLLTGLAALNFLSIQSSMIYLFTYTFATLAAFGVLSVVSINHHLQATDAEDLQHYRGLFWKQPYLAAIMMISMLSLAGMPMTVGFIGKFYVILSAVNSSMWWLLSILVISSGIGLYFYLRVIVTLFLHTPRIARLRTPFSWGLSACGAMLIITTVVIMLLGVYPQPMLDLVSLGSL